MAENSHKPGEIVKTSGIYSVVHEDRKHTFEVTCVEGEHFPPTRAGQRCALRAEIRRNSLTQTQ